MPQAVKCDLVLYTKDTGCTFQHENEKEIEDKLHWNLISLCDWFITNKLNICFSEYNTKSILFKTKFNIKRAEPLNIVYGNVRINELCKLLT